MEWLNTELILQIVRTLGVVTASLIAIIGVNKWRKEARWKKKYELAEEVLALFYEARDNLFFIRSPASYESEGKSRKPGENESPEEKRARDNAYVFYERYEKVSTCFNKLRSLKYRFMAVFGDNYATPFEDMHKIVQDILIAATRIADYWDYRKEYRGKIQELETLVWATYDNDDPIQKRVDAAIGKMEKIAKPILMRKN